jgi:hypothetical protein
MIREARADERELVGELRVAAYRANLVLALCAYELGLPPGD